MNKVCKFFVSYYPTATSQDHRLVDITRLSLKTTLRASLPASPIAVMYALNNMLLMRLISMGSPFRQYDRRFVTGRH